MIYSVWLQNVLGAGSSNALRVLKFFGSAEAVYKSTKEQRLQSGVFTRKNLERMENNSLEAAKKVIDSCRENNISLISYCSKEYPRLLKEISSPPLVLYVKGRLPDFNSKPSICIVGSRNVSEYGKRAAYSLGYRLAAAGFIVVSGGALGTDTYAHAGAIRAGGETVLCMGSGILSNYLVKNKSLRDCIAMGGCLLSEYQPHSPATKFTFPVRNRIMSGLTLGTVVIEAAEKSGSLITAHHAAEQGRDVFVVPNTPGDAHYVGSNALLRDGAKPLIDASDIFNEYIVDFPDKINIENAFSKPIIEKKEGVAPSQIKKDEKIIKKLPETLSNEAKIVYNQLDKHKFLPEDIKATGIEGGRLLSVLTELEMEFLIKALPGGMYEKC